VCGICGILGQPSEIMTKSMTQAMERRGHDGEGFYLDSFISVGVRRLQITGPLENDQPIWNEDHTICIVFNGEIYNFRELRINLESNGHVFRSSSDTEVILHLYEDLGEDCVQYLKGMFAFAIWDGEKLFLARDRMGIKPLFYASVNDNQQLIFASEIKALLAHPDVSHARHEPSWHELSVFGYVLSESDTLIENIKQVRPGSEITATLHDGSIRIEECIYAQKCPDQETGIIRQETSIGSSVDRFENALRESCQRIMNQDDRPKGLYLSGGIDSSLISVLCHEESSIPIHTFTLGDSLENDDVRYARQVATAIGSIHHEIIVCKDECEREYPTFLQACETAPSEGTFDMHGDFCFFLLSKYVSKHVKVAICGEGADELTGGYWMHKWPLGYVDSLRERLGRMGKKDVTMIEKELEQWFAQPEDVDRYRQGVFDLLLGTGLSNYHLWAVDRASMWHGLEVRVPYLYDPVVEVARSLPMEHKATRHTSKIVSRKLANKIFEPYGLLHIIDREKKAMPNAIEHLKLDQLDIYRESSLLAQTRQG